MADRIELVGLRARGLHGVFDHEREQGQDFVVDLVLHTDVREAAAGADLGAPTDYGVVARQVHDLVAGEPVALVETLAERIAALVLTHARVDAVDVAVHKPQAPVAVPFDDVVVRVHRAVAREAG